ncbi:DNA-processing protein DprA [Nocardia sp. NPDC058114]|uniref:DNA-processing protein DprA n=1 Tax=Nocardia sp. NPDC058114 TaxID=3346346 RepID=UPI0036DB6E47
MDSSTTAERARHLGWAIIARAALDHRGAVSILLAAEGPTGAAEALTRTTPGLTVRAAGDLSNAAHIGARLITPDSPEWPRQLTELDDPSVNSSAPVALWARGAGHLGPAGPRGLAVVGARACTSHGRAAPYELTAAVAAQGSVIVTGGAYGIDTAALDATLSVDGSAIVVTASGLGHTYPASNSDLFEKVTGRGVLVSEYPPFDRPTRDRFLHRNRVIAALAGSGMVVPEAGIRSGTLNAVGWANRLHRPVFALPTPTPSAPAWAGCAAIIDDGRAHLVTDVDQLLVGLGAGR